MGRSGWSEWSGDSSDELWAMIRQAGALKSAVRGKRGRKFLADLAAALDAMPEKRLLRNDLVTEEGDEVCALGCLMKARGLPPGEFDPEDHEGLGKVLDIAPILVQQVEWENDEYASYDKTGKDDGERRWHWMRRWVDGELKEIARYDARKKRGEAPGEAP